MAIVAYIAIDSSFMVLLSQFLTLFFSFSIIHFPSCTERRLKLTFRMGRDVASLMTNRRGMCVMSIFKCLVAKYFYTKTKIRQITLLRYFRKNENSPTYRILHCAPVGALMHHSFFFIDCTTFPRPFESVRRDNGYDHTKCKFTFFQFPGNCQVLQASEISDRVKNNSLSVHLYTISRLVKVSMDDEF